MLRASDTKAPSDSRSDLMRFNAAAAPSASRKSGIGAFRMADAVTALPIRDAKALALDVMFLQFAPATTAKFAATFAPVAYVASHW